MGDASPAEHACAGTSASVIAMALLYPLDTVRGAALSPLVHRSPWGGVTRCESSFKVHHVRSGFPVWRKHDVCLCVGSGAVVARPSHTVAGTTRSIQIARWPGFAVQGTAVDAVYR